MKPFNLELAKAGHPVCTRDGRDARIICFDRKDTKYPIIILVNKGKEEVVVSCNLDGQINNSNFNDYDLFMKPTKKEGWINIYEDKLFGTQGKCGCIYESKEEAIKNYDKCTHDEYIATIKIEWEE